MANGKGYAPPKYQHPVSWEVVTANSDTSMDLILFKGHQFAKLWDSACHLGILNHTNKE